MNTTDAGLHFFTNVARARGGLDSSAPHRVDATGWVAPTDIYREMSDLNANAVKLDALVNANVPNDQQGTAFRTGWKAWLASWNEFYALKVTDRATFDFSTALNSDAVKAQADAYWTQYANWEKSYSALVGRPVPSPVTPAPPTPAELDKERSGSGWHVPWWIWMGAGIAVVGVGVWGYFKAKDLMAKKRMIETRVLPAVFSSSFGPEVGRPLAEAAAAHDMARRDPLALTHYVEPAATVARDQVREETSLGDMFSYPARNLPPPVRDTYRAEDLYDDGFDD